MRMTSYNRFAQHASNARQCSRVTSMRILAFHAHPDDAEILAGGTLAILAARGHELTIATMTCGDCGSAEMGAQETAEVRRREAEEAAALVGASYRSAGFQDLAVFNDDPSRRRVTAILREVRPDIVITAAPVDYMCDHEATSDLIRDCCFGAPAPNYATEGTAPPLKSIPHLYFMQPLGNVDRAGAFVAPDFVVDVSTVIETKRALVACHKSQRDWLRAHHGMDEYLEMMERWSRRLGEEVGRQFGEGFRRYKGHPYPQTPLLETLLEGLVLPYPMRPA